MTTGQRYLDDLKAKDARKTFEAKLADPFQAEALAYEREINRTNRKRAKVQVDCPQLDEWSLATGLHFTVAFVGYIPEAGLERAPSGRHYRCFSKRYQLMVRRAATYNNRTVITPEIVATFPFQQGMAFGAHPTVSGIMANLATECRMASEYDDVGSFIADLYDGDTMNGWRVFDQIKAHMADLHRLLTRERYDELLRIADENY